MAFRQSLNVGRVIQVTLSLQLNEPGIVLSHALHTLMTHSDRMGTPVGSGQFLVAICANGNSAVNNGNQVSIGDQVEDMTSPGAINAGKQNVTIECGTESGVLVDGGHHGEGVESRRRCAFAQVL